MNLSPLLPNYKSSQILAEGEALAEPEVDPYESISAFRSKERTQMIVSIREFIEEAQKRARSKNTPSGERVKWMNLAGKLIWYKDQILRSMTHEAMEKEVAELKKRVFKKDDPATPSHP